MNVIGNAKYNRRVHGIYYQKSFDGVEITDIEFNETKGRLTVGEWIGLVEVAGKELKVSRFGKKTHPPKNGLDWNAIDAQVKNSIKVSFSTKRLVPWLTDELHRKPSILEINRVIDAVRGDIRKLVRENIPWID